MDVEAMAVEEGDSTPLPIRRGSRVICPASSRMMPAADIFFPVHPTLVVAKGPTPPRCAAEMGNTSLTPKTKPPQQPQPLLRSVPGGDPIPDTTSPSTMTPSKTMAQEISRRPVITSAITPTFLAMVAKYSMEELFTNSLSHIGEFNSISTASGNASVATLRTESSKLLIVIDNV